MQKKQECIPVGCVLPAAVAVWVGLRQVPIPPGPGTPPDQAPPLGPGTPGTRHPWDKAPLGQGTPSQDQTPPLWTDTHL